MKSFYKEAEEDWRRWNVGAALDATPQTTTEVAERCGIKMLRVSRALQWAAGQRLVAVTYYKAANGLLRPLWAAVAGKR